MNLDEIAWMWGNLDGVEPTWTNLDAVDGICWICVLVQTWKDSGRFGWTLVDFSELGLSWRGAFGFRWTWMD